MGLVDNVKAAFRQCNEDHDDAERWRALMRCARVRVLGSSGILEKKDSGYAHIGLEMWTLHSECCDSESAKRMLTAFAEIARKSV